MTLNLTVLGDALGRGQDGSSYEGEWAEDKMCGRGTFTEANKRCAGASRGACEGARGAHAGRDMVRPGVSCTCGRGVEDPGRGVSTVLSAAWQELHGRVLQREVCVPT